MSRSLRSRAVAPALVAFAVALAAAAAGCTEKLVSPPPPDPVFGVPDSIQEIFTASCAFSNCHGGSTPRQGMGLGDARTSWLAIVGVAAAQNGAFLRIAPGDSADSYLVMKLRNDARIGSSDPMPLGAFPLDGGLVMRIAAWAEAGAPGQDLSAAGRQPPIFSTSTNVE